jgi:hypothetical protein
VVAWTRFMALDDSDAPSRRSEGSLEDEPTLAAPSRRIRCAVCQTVIADPARLLPVGETANPVFVNPAGVFFDVVLVENLIHVSVRGEPTTDATWFAGYAWSFVLCGTCLVHLGWKWKASPCERTPISFFGVIRSRVVFDSQNQS